MVKLAYFSNINPIVETENFCIFIPNKPHIDKNDGGHICIAIKGQDIFLVQDLTDEQLFELSVLTKIVGEAMITVLNSQGIDVKLINYQINGNWTYNSVNRANLHMHLYGRALSSKKQVFGQSLYFPDRNENAEFYSSNKPLSNDDATALNKYIVNAISNKYSDIITVI